jgi:hypothetical protein
LKEQKQRENAMYLNTIKTVRDSVMAYIILREEKLKSFLLRVGTWKGCPLSYLTNCYQCMSARPKRQEKEIKGKEERRR